MFRCLFWGQALSKHLRSAVAAPSPISCSSCSVSILVLSGSQRFETYPQKRTFDLTVNEHTPFCNGPAASSRHAAELTLLSVVGAQAATLLEGTVSSISKFRQLFGRCRRRRPSRGLSQEMSHATLAPRETASGCCSTHS